MVIKQVRWAHMMIGNEGPKIHTRYRTRNNEGLELWHQGKEAEKTEIKCEKKGLRGPQPDWQTPQLRKNQKQLGTRVVIGPV